MQKPIALTLLLLTLSVARADAPASQPAAKLAATQPATQPFDQEAAARLIRQLGDDQFTVREAATQKLIDMGEAVRPLLVEKAKEKGLDPDVADRIKRVIGPHWHILKGQVVDQSGNLVANASVCPVFTVTTGPSFLGDEVRTQADGTFVLRLPPDPDSECQAIFVRDGGQVIYKLVPPFRQKADEATDMGVLKLGSVIPTTIPG